MDGSGLDLWVEWIIGALALYGISHLAVAVGRRLLRLEDRDARPIHYMVWTSESAQHVEYWLRRIRWEAQLTGRDYRIFWRDERSGDETGLIMERMATQEAAGTFFSEGPSGVQPPAVFPMEHGANPHHPKRGLAFSPPQPAAVLLDLRTDDEEVSECLKKM